MFKKMQKQEVQIINLPKIVDARGNLSIIEEFNQIPFKIERCYWVYDVPGGVERGGHAYKTNMEFIVALSGSFDVILNDGKNRVLHHLNRSYYGLFIPEMMWREIENFSTNSVAFVLASKPYNADDYIRDFESFRKEAMK
jgi:dTDP-4-dehydrorhamnose 3,5-epimerase-like enzyme